MAFRFRNFKVYQEAKNLHKEIVIITKDFPRQHYYLIDQIRRASLSIVLNIAEGSSRQSDKDFNRFIATSLGSLDETVACLEIALEEGLVDKKNYLALENKFEVLSLQLGSLSKKLKSQ